jgi:Glycosyl hydrolases family 43
MRSRWVRSLGALAFGAGLVATGPAAMSVEAAQPQTGPTYTNPVSRGLADTFADPSLIRGKDGWWYSFGTSDPLREGEATPHRIPMARSHDLVHWTYVGDAFADATLPSWAEQDAGLWAPDIRYVDGQYRMYYVVTQTKVTPDRDDNAIGMATAPTPRGPWTDSGAPVVGPRRGNGGYLWTFDPSVVSDRDGSQWVFFGSYNGGVFVQPLNDEGTATTGSATMVAIDNKFEGAYVVRHGGFWYQFASTANCCAGPTTGYSVQVGRSLDLRGPYVDAQGTPLLASRAGGTPVLNQNGNRWVGAGHNAIARDVTGQDWIVYHALDRGDPYLNGTSGINQRPMLMDRLDWVHGWPVVRGGRGPSDTRQPAPVTTSDSRLVTTESGTLAGNRRGDVRLGRAHPRRPHHRASRCPRAAAGGTLRREACRAHRPAPLRSRPPHAAQRCPRGAREHRLRRAEPGPSRRPARTALTHAPDVAAVGRRPRRCACVGHRFGRKRHGRRSRAAGDAGRRRRRAVAAGAVGERRV